MATPLLKLPTLPFNTSKKEVIFNDAITTLEDSLNRTLTIDLSSNDYVLQEKNAVKYGMLNFYPVSGEKDVIIPNITRPIFLKNSGTGTVNFKFKIKKRYWRLFFYGPQNNSIKVGFRNLEMASKPDGENLCVGGTAYTSATGTTANGAFSDNGWESTSNYLWGWVSYDFNSPVIIEEIRLRASATNTYTISFGILQWSDDNVSWNTYEILSLGSFSANQTKSFRVSENYSLQTSYPHRFWKIEATNSASNWFAVSELYFAMTPGGVQAAVGGSVIAGTANDAANHPLNAFDGNTATNANTGLNSGIYFNADKAFMGYIFPTGTEPVEFRIRAKSSNFADTPTSFNLYSSYDGIHWTLRKAVVGEPAWIASEVRSYTIAASSAPAEIPLNREILVLPSGKTVFIHIQESIYRTIATDNETFVNLTDVSGSGPWTNHSNKNLRVNIAENAVESSTRNNMSATTTPTISDDSSANYSIGSLWFDSSKGILWVCESASVGAAVWRRYISAKNMHGGYRATASVPTTLLNATTAAGGVVAGRFLFYPFVIYKKIFATYAAIRVTGAGDAASVCKLAFFPNSFTNGTPTSTALTGSNTDIATNTTGIKTVSLSYAFEPGVYWACIVINSPGTFPTFNGAPAGQHNYMKVHGYSGNGAFTVLVGASNQGHFGYYYDSTYATDIMTLDTTSLTFSRSTANNSRNPNIILGY